MRVLAIHSDQASHDSSCCIYDGGSIIYFLEERYSGIKHDSSLDYCLFNVLKTGLRFDKIVISGMMNPQISNHHNFDETKLKKITNNLSSLVKMSYLTPDLGIDLNIENIEEKLLLQIKDLPLPNILKENEEVSRQWSELSFENKKFILSYYKKYDHFPQIEFDSKHHRSHASLAFYNSGFEKAIVFIADGAGEVVLSTSSKERFLFYKESESLYVASYPNSFKPIYKNFGSPAGHDYIKEIESIKHTNPDCETHFRNYLSLGLLYGSGAKLIDEKMDEAGKVMGLSSYGTPTNNNYIVDDYFVNADLFECYSHDFIPGFAPPNGYSKNLHYKPVNGRSANEKGGPEDTVVPNHLEPTLVLTKKNYKPYADYAKDLQLQTQEAAAKLIKKAIDKTGIKKVCVSGGYGMNILSNSYYIKQFPGVEFYFEPLSIDSGISIGCAMYHYRKETADTTIRPLTSISFHGVKHDVSSYRGVDNSIEDIAKLLYDNKSVAVYTGLAEAGQRALGNRSILFNALNVNAKDIVNKIKKREWYRPFAAVVLEEDAGLYFDISATKKNLFMTQSFDVITDLIPGVTHVDNTCRVQTVSKESGYLYGLLLEFKKLSGHGILLNTSFNLAGRPLVESPKQAFETLQTSVLDYLWFEETKQLFSKH